MVTHFFTLHALCKELHPILRSSIISEVFNQQRNELLISLVPLTDKPSTTSTLHISVEPKMNYFVLREEASRARKNSVDLFSMLVGKTILKLTTHPSDRTVMMEMGDGWTMLFQLYDTIASNILLVDNQKKIQDAFKHHNELTGTQLPDVAARYDIEIISDEALFLQRMHEHDSGTAFAVLKKLLPHIGALYMHEIFCRANIQEETSIRDLDDTVLRQLSSTFRALLDEIEHPAPILYRHNEKIKALSVMPLQSCSSLQHELFTSVNSCIRAAVGFRFREQGVASKREALLRPIRSEYHRVQRAQEKIAGLKPIDPQGYEHFGNCLLSHLHEIHKGMRNITLPDFNAEKPTVEIVLDPMLTPSQNAARYFEKAKHAKHARGETDKRMSELTLRSEALRTLELDLLRCETLDNLKEFTHNHRQELLRMNLIKEQSGAPLPPFRIFSVTGGFEVWVGKSSANNDLLTMKYAKANDLWFHVRGASGSHTVLKVHGGSDAPPKEAIYQAAAIAAYYSKMRKAGSVPVAYCERKHVRKPKGLNEGAVVMEREKVVFVKPNLP